MTKPAIIPFDAAIPLQPWPDFPDSDVCAGDRSHRGHLWVDDTAAGLRAGIWEAEANLGRWMIWPVDEFMILLEGEVVMVEEDRETIIRAGDSFIIPKGCRCIWNQWGYAKKFMVMFDRGTAGAPGGPSRVIKIDPKVALAASAPPAASVLLSPVPTQHTHDYFADSTGQFSVGVWDTTGYHRKLIDFPRHELMHLLEGSVTFTDDKGGSRTFKAGDTFFVPLGTPNAWRSEGYLKKIFVTFQPKA